MLKRTEAILMKTVKFRETSIIAHVFTPDDGIVPLIVSGVRTQKNKGKAAQFQLGQILEVVYYDKQKEGVMRLKESAATIHYRSIPLQITKIALLQYFIEVTRNCMYQAAVVADDVYTLLRNTLIYLDNHDGTNINLSTYYLWHLIDKMGLAPNLDLERGEYFDLQSGDYAMTMPQHKSAITLPVAQKLNELMQTPFTEIEFMDIGPRERKQLLEAGHIFLKIHLSYFRMPKSADIYRDILKL